MTVNLTIPVLNEAVRLAACVPAVLSFIAAHPEHSWELVIADNGSTDGTVDLARRLSKADPRLRVCHMPEKGRGRALKRTWLESHADMLTYMDVDLSTDLEAFPKLVEALATRGYDLATGSRFLLDSKVTRSWKREAVSRSYNLLVKAVFRTRFSDAQCGFKAITRPAADELLPLVEDPGWFFDTELLVLAEKLGCRICDVPVRWVEDRNSRVNVIPTALGDIRGLIRMKRNFRRGKYAGHAPARPLESATANERQ
jgi:glycosyltransferase involved in cell wall biosynthesis